MGVRRAPGDRVRQARDDRAVVGEVAEARCAAVARGRRGRADARCGLRGLGAPASTARLQRSRAAARCALDGSRSMSSSGAPASSSSSSRRRSRSARSAASCSRMPASSAARVVRVAERRRSPPRRRRSRMPRPGHRDRRRVSRRARSAARVGAERLGEDVVPDRRRSVARSIRSGTEAKSAARRVDGAPRWPRPRPPCGDRRAAVLRGRQPGAPARRRRRHPRRGGPAAARARRSRVPRRPAAAETSTPASAWAPLESVRRLTAGVRQRRSALARARRGPSRAAADSARRRGVAHLLGRRDDVVADRLVGAGSGSRVLGRAAHRARLAVDERRGELARVPGEPAPQQIGHAARAPRRAGRSRRDRRPRRRAGRSARRSASRAAASRPATAVSAGFRGFEASASARA